MYRKIFEKQIYDCIALKNLLRTFDKGYTTDSEGTVAEEIQMVPNILAENQYILCVSEISTLFLAQPH